MFLSGKPFCRMLHMSGDLIDLEAVLKKPKEVGATRVVRTKTRLSMCAGHRRSGAFALQRSCQADRRQPRSDGEAPPPPQAAAFRLLQFSHVSMSGFNTMNRVLKLYKFAYGEPRNFNSQRCQSASSMQTKAAFPVTPTRFQGW